jgi:putative transcriptional regulator
MIKIHLSRILGDRRMLQSELSRKTKIRKNTINAYYHGYIERINVKDLNKICDALNCRLDELIEYIPDKNGII